MKKTLKILSIALTVALVIGIFSCTTPVFAAEVTEKDALNLTLEQYKTEIENSEGKTLYEIEEERDAFTKVFKNNDGSKTAIVSATPIHYETDEGWEDIENTLVEEKSVTGEVYKNKNNDFTVTIPKEMSENKELEIEKDNYSVSFEIEGSDIFLADKKVKGSKKNKQKKSIENPGEINTDFLDKTSAVVFENVGENTSVEYEVTSTGLKENIILNQKPVNEVTYKYKIKTKDLIGKLDEDNSVMFSSNDGAEIFEIPAPIMYDAENVASKDIEVSLTGKNGKYTLIYKPSYEWLSGDVTYPVVIDPVINTSNEFWSVKDTISDSAHANENYGDYPVLHTYKSDTGNLQSFIDISKNILKNGAKLKSVLLGLYYETGVFTDDSTTVAAYTITSDWDESTLTYNNRPTTINSLIDRIDVNRDSEAGYLVFDVTEAYTLKEKTYGVCIRQRDAVTNEAMLYFSSSECSTTSQKPFFIIEYYETLGVEEQFDYHSFDVGRAGTAYFNDFTEQVYIERDELGLSGINMPVQIKRYYNSNYGGTNSGIYSFYANYSSFYGFGWMTNYDQFVEYKGTVDDKDTILYHNGEGKIIYFEKGSADSQTGKTVWDEKTDGFSNSEGYKLYIPTQYEDSVSSNYEHITIQESSGQIYEFNSSGFLSKINSAEENSSKAITITYNEDESISKVRDGVGREYRFSYTEYENWLFPLLTSIQAFSPSGSEITVDDDSGEKIPYKMTYNYTFANYMDLTDCPLLSSVTYPDGESVYYTVADNLISLKNIDGYAIEFAFNQNNTVISEKVYSDSATDFTSGGQLTITDENSYEKSYVDLNGTKITKQFDMYGRTINTKNNGDITQSVARTYSDDYKAQGSVYYSFYNTYEQDFTGEETNLVTNGSFTTNLSGWAVSNSSIVTHNTTEDCVTNSDSPGSLKIKGKQSSRRYAYQIIDIENGLAGDEYRLDYFKNNDDYAHLLIDLGYLSTVIIQARNSNDDGEWQRVALVEENPLNPRWQKYSYSFDIDFEYDEIKIILVHYYQYGSVYFDDISLVNTYKAPANQATDTENDNTDTGSGNSDTLGCNCVGCSTPNCPCTACSENCTLPYCNRGYDFKNDSNGTSFSITDGEKTMAMEQNISGNYYGSQTDLNGIYTGYSYNQMNGQLEYMSDSNGNVTNFYYDAMSRLKKVSNDANGIKMETSYSYDNDRIKSITHNDFSYNYEYDAWGNPSEVKVGEQALVTYNYGDNEEYDPQYRDRINRITYGNGDYTDYDYDNDGNIETIKSYSSENTLVADYLYAYDENGQIEKITNNIEDTEIRYIDGGYDFVKPNGEGEEDDFVIYSKSIEDDGKTVEILAGKEYNETDGTTHSDAVSGTTSSTTSVTTPLSSYSVASATDYFGRVKYKDTILATEVGNGYTGTEKIREAYEYADSQDPEEPDRTTGLVSKYTITYGTYIETVDKEILPNLSTGFYEIFSIEEYLYDYDGKGNITRIRLRTVDADGDETLTEINSYIYDSANQLVRENNAELNKTFVYVYDKGGNIAQKKEYAYSTGELGEAVSVINYSYDSAWKDKLTAYGDTQIQTDAMGNPLNYSGISINDVEVSGTLEWNGRQLAAANVGNERFEYTYDANGLRSSVKYYASGGELDRTYYYIWQNGKLVGYYVENATSGIGTSIKMLFDEKGEPIGYMAIETGEDATSECFWFRKNLQGDIIAVCEQNGNEIITYSYDAWGKVVCTAQSSDVSDVLSALICTPITYRGYNYDVFTGLYYLQSRYYNPTYGRFLNADTTEILEATQGTPHGANLFAYCNNNPVNRVDRTGYLSIYEQNSDGSYRGWVGVGVQICVVPSIMHFGYNFGAEAIRFFPNNNFNNYNKPWLYKFGGWGVSISFNVADIVTALMFGNPLSLIKSLLLNGVAGFTIVFSVFFVFAKNFTSPNNYEGPFLVQQFNLPVGVLSVAHDEKNEVLTIGFGVTIINGFVVGGFSAFPIGSIGYGNSKLDYYLWEV